MPVFIICIFVLYFSNIVQVMNHVGLVHIETVLKLIGIFIPPLGVVMGLIGLF